MGYIVLLIILTICIAGIVEIVKNKYPSGILIPVIILLLIQIGAILGANGNISYKGSTSDEFSSDLTFYVGIVAYYIGYFIWGIISTIILFVCINHYDKVTKNE